METRDFESAQAFLLGAKNFWTTSMFRQLRATYDRKVNQRSPDAMSPEQAAKEIQQDTTYQYFAWLERHLQRMKYTGRYGLIPYHAERRDQLLTDDLAGEDEYAPKLRPDLSLPKYYKSLDIHQHRGGLWSEDIAGFVYEYGARTTTPLLGEAHEDLHDRFTDQLANTDFKRILDLGCGFGKSTRPFARRHPDAQVEAVDLSAPCLMVGASFARQNRTKNVRYSQQDARHTDFADETFDLVTSTMLLHEMPVKSLLQLLNECFRLLKPGGTMAHLDFYILPDEFIRLMHYGHSKRNNETFMTGLVEMDLPRALKEAGFDAVTIERFKEGANVDLDAHEAWRFPWTTIIATKPR